MTGLMIAYETGAAPDVLDVAALLTDWRMLAFMACLELATLFAVCRWCWRAVVAFRRRHPCRRRAPPD